MSASRARSFPSAVTPVLSFTTAGTRVAVATRSSSRENSTRTGFPPVWRASATEIASLIKVFFPPNEPPTPVTISRTLSVDTPSAAVSSLRIWKGRSVGSHSV